MELCFSVLVVVKMTRKMRMSAQQIFEGQRMHDSPLCFDLIVGSDDLPSFA